MKTVAKINRNFLILKLVNFQLKFDEIYEMYLSRRNVAQLLYIFLHNVIILCSEVILKFYSPINVYEGEKPVFIRNYHFPCMHE